jgi:lysophospholipase L1-like esterase
VIGRWLLALVAFVLTDASAAHILLRVRPNIDMPPAERQRIARLEQEAVERRYRIESAVYDHDLAKQFDGIASWGPLRYRITTDSLGFKDASPRVVPLSATTRRVLLLGDSFTEGLGLAYEESYAGRIAERLRRERVEVLNAAVTSYSPAIYYAKTRYLLERGGLQFSDVVVFIDMSDAEDEARYYDLHADGRVTRMVDQHPGRGPEFEVPPDVLPLVPAPPTLGADGRPRRVIDTPTIPSAPDASMADTRSSNRVLSALTRRSVVLRMLRALEERRHASPLPYPQGNPRRALWTVDERDYEAFGRTGLELGSRHMDRLVELLKRHAIALTIAVYPWPEQLRYDSADSIQARYWRRWAQQRGVRFVDLFGPLFRAPDREATIRRFYIPGDVHFNRDGAKFVATEFLTQWPEGAAP